jgi:hypothetical protein
MEEARVRSHQHQLAAILITYPQGAEPGGELVGIELLLKLSLEKRPIRLRHETSNSDSYTISTQFPQAVENPCLEEDYF